MFKKLNVFVLTFFVLVQSFIMPFSASSASYESILFGAAMASAQENDAVNDATPTATSEQGTDIADANKLEAKLIFDRLVYKGKDIKNENDAETVSPRADEEVVIHYNFKTEEIIEGQQMTFQLPKNLLLYDEAALKGSIPIEGVQYFTYKTDIKTHTVTVTATKT